MSKVFKLARVCNPRTLTLNRLISDQILIRKFSDSVTDGINHDLKKRFYEPEVQSLLSQLTRMDFDVLFRTQKLEKRLGTPKYKFMTTKEVEQEFATVKEKALKKLQMPPVLPPRKEINEVICVDEDLSGLEGTNSNILFTDISFGKTDRNRVIVVREPEGTLRRANWDERHRMNHIYFPLDGRKLFTPRLFKQENLLDLCKRHEYEFVLNLAGLQFEPDDNEYLRVTVTVYDHVDESQNYNLLRSTRHYGPLVFHLVTQRNIDNLIIENLQSDRLEDAVWAINLFHLLKPDSKSAKTKCVAGEEMAFIKSYIEQDSTKRGVLEMSMNTYLDAKEAVPGIQKAPA